MSLRMMIVGIDDWAKFPAAVRAAVPPRVEAAARRAAGRVEAAYPTGKTGELKKGVKVWEVAKGDRDRTFYMVASTAPYAAHYEFGSQVGGQRPRPTFVPITTEERRAMAADLSALVSEAWEKL